MGISSQKTLAFCLGWAMTVCFGFYDMIVIVKFVVSGWFMIDFLAMDFF